MSTTLVNCLTELSKQLGDYWSSTTTGAGSTTTLVDSALMAKANDWITDDCWAFLIEEPASAAAIYDERKISSLDNSTGTLTTLAFGEAPGTGIDYQVHRLFSPSDKRIALVAAARRVFPSLFQEVWDESLVSGNWLKDGSFERWTTSADLTDWTETTVTVTQTSTLPYFKHSIYSAKLSTAAGTLDQEITELGDLQFLRGRNVTFTCQGWCDTASCLRLSINDGTTQTYSSYHAGDSAWTEDDPRNDSFYVTQYVTPNATQVTFTIHHEKAAGTSYVDDARVISDYRGKTSIGYLWLAQNRPHRIEIEPSYYSTEEPWIPVRDWHVDPNGYLYLPTCYQSDRRLRIRGIGYLDFLASGVSSTAWTATISLNQPQLDILIAQAALILYTQMALPNYETGTRDEFAKAAGYWKAELQDRVTKYSMKAPSATVHWGRG